MRTVHMIVDANSKQKTGLGCAHVYKVLIYMKNLFFKQLENNDFFQKFKKFQAKQGFTSGK